jgi:hypothetical protein
MSGPLGSAQWMYASETGYQIEDSLRFEDGSSAYLNRTPASAGNRQTFTYSFWTKLGGAISSSGDIISSQNGVGSGDAIAIQSTNRLAIAGSGTNLLVTTQLLRDPSAWYHVVLAIDTTQATSSNRIKLYINGVQVTSFSTTNYPALNYNFAYWNNTFGQLICRGYTYFDGYLTDINFIDGQALDATDFGETIDGYWRPIPYAGTYGTNGFHLDFNGNTNDASGNGNDWTANNISAHDYVPDSPTNNFATLNSLANAGSTFSEGNLKISFSDDGSYNPPVETSTFTIPSSGKWYFEGLLVSSTAMGIGVQDNTDVKVLRGSVDYGVYYLDSGNIYTYVNGTDTNVDSSPASYTTGDIIGVAYNADTNSISWYKNGVLQTSYTPSTGYDFTPAFYAYASTVAANFGQDSTFSGATTAGGNSDANGVGDFAYAPPSGYLALCTANLPTPTIIDGSEHFNTVLYTGTGATQSITGVGFGSAPDWVWIKDRSVAGRDHQQIDSVRGATKTLKSSTTLAEQTLNSVTSFDSDGFTVGNESGANASGSALVAWNWKAGGTAVANTDGSISSQVSANVDAGFSIVSYTGNGTAGATIGHGLGVAPDCVITKVRSNGTYGWWIYISSVSNGYLNLPSNLGLQTSDAQIVYGNGSVVVNPNSSVVTVGGYNGVNQSGQTFIQYCFANVEGYSKAGSYTGNGSTDGTFVYTGFRPAFVLFKGIDAAYSWTMYDSTRDNYNFVDKTLYPSFSASENTGTPRWDFLSNGFKARDNDNDNVSGQRYIYIAFAETPFKYANAR